MRVTTNFVFVSHLLARGTRWRVPRCIPFGSGAAIGIEPYPHQWGDFTLPKPHQQNGRACPLETCLCPRDQTFAVWIRATSWRSEFSHPEPRQGETSFSPRPHDQKGVPAPWNPDHFMETTGAFRTPLDTHDQPCADWMRTMVCAHGDEQKRAYFALES